MKLGWSYLYLIFLLNVGFLSAQSDNSFRAIVEAAFTPVGSSPARTHNQQPGFYLTVTQNSDQGGSRLQRTRINDQTQSRLTSNEIRQFKAYTREQWLDYLNINNLLIRQLEGSSIIEDSKIILTRWELYFFEEFRETIRNLPNYANLMGLLAHNVQHNAQLNQEISKINPAISQYIVQEGHLLKLEYSQRGYTQSHITQKKEQIALIKKQLLEQQKHTAAITKFNDQRLSEVEKAFLLGQLQTNTVLMEHAQKIEQLLAAIESGNNGVQDFRYPIRLTQADADFLNGKGYNSNSFNCVGNQLQRYLFAECAKTIEQIAKLATTSSVTDQNKAYFDRILADSLMSLNNAISSNEQGNIELVFNNLRDSLVKVEFAQMVSKGLINFDSKTRAALKNDCIKQKEHIFNKIDPFFSSSACIDKCIQDCPNSAEHQMRRYLNTRALQLTSIIQSLAESTGNTITIFTPQPLSDGVNQLLAQADLPDTAFQQSIGDAAMRLSHQQALDLLNQAMTMQNREDQIVLVHLSHDCVQAARSGDIARAQSYLKMGYQLAALDCVSQAMPKELKQEPLSIETLVYSTYHKTAEILKHPGQFGWGLAKGSAESMYGLFHMALHPSEIVKEAKIIADSAKLIGGKVKNTVTDYALMKWPGLATKERKAAEERMLVRYEKAVVLLEAFAQTANEMSPEEIGASIGKLAVDVVTGDIVLKGATSLARQSKYLVDAIQRSEKIANANRKLSKRAEKVSKSINEFGDKCKNVFKPTAEVVDAATGTKIPAASLMDNATNTVGSGAQAASTGAKVIANNYQSLAKFVSASTSVADLAAQCGNEVQNIINSVTSACNAIGLSLPDLETFYHVTSRHMIGGSKAIRPNGTSRSLFSIGEDWLQLGIEAWEKGILTEVGVKEYDFGRIIGVAQTGKSTSKIRIVTGGNRFVTAYPI